GFEEHTIVVVIADHGEELEERGVLGHGHSLYRELLRVPFAIRAPGFAPRRVPEVVRQIDLVPTLLELVGLPAVSDLAGRSLLPALRGAAVDERPALAELQRGPHPMESLRTQGFKLIRTTADGRAELFDLAADPQELTDVAAQNPAKVAELTRVLDEWK